MQDHKTRYETRQIERIIAAELARRFAGNVNEEQTEKILAAQKAKDEAQHNFRMVVTDVVGSLLR